MVRGRAVNEEGAEEMFGKCDEPCCTEKGATETTA
jgi:hypothetical protein